MKVLLVSNEADFVGDLSKVTGVGRYARDIYAWLTKTGKVDVKIVGFDTTSVVRTIITAFSSALRDLSKFDIIHVLTPKPFFPLRKGRAIFVQTVHDLVPCFSGFNVFPPIVWSIYKKSMSMADAYIAVSTLTRDDLISFGLAKNKRVFVVNPGVDDSFFENLTNRRELSKKDKFVIGYVGRVDLRRKNIIRALEVFREYKYENVEFHIWGGYDDGSEIMRRVREYMKEDPRIKLMGPFPQSQAIKIYDSFDALFMPSLLEGFGLPIVEAQARGVPVIVFEKARIPPEVCRLCIKIKDGLPSPEDIVKYREEFYTEMVNEASKFRLSVKIKELLDVYYSLLNSVS